MHGIERESYTQSSTKKLCKKKVLRDNGRGKKREKCSYCTLKNSDSTSEPSVAKELRLCKKSVHIGGVS